MGKNSEILGKKFQVLSRGLIGGMTDIDPLTLSGANLLPISLKMHGAWTVTGLNELILQTQNPPLTFRCFSVRQFISCERSHELAM
jgi:hypothetical protein